MSNSPRPYQSRLFNFLNRQSIQWRDRLGETLRQIKVAAEWGVQAIVHPLYWLLHPQEWLGPKLSGGSSTSSLGPSQDYLSDPPVDQPLTQVLGAIQPWFELDGGEAMPLPPTPQREIRLPGSFFTALREQLKQGHSPQALPSAPATATLALPPSPLAQLGQHFKQTFSSQPDLIIQGLACQCGDAKSSRQLVLITSNNEILDILSEEQKKELETVIRLELANFHYQRRIQWALTQQSLGIIPLISPETRDVVAPLKWVWQGLQFWESRRWPTVLPSANVSALTITAPSAIKATKPQSKSVPDLIPSLQAELIQRLQSAGGQLQNQWHHLSQQAQEIIGTSSHLSVHEPDPFQIQVIIQAAIAYFFGTGQQVSFAGETATSLTGQDEDPWLSWDDLFLESNPTSLIAAGAGSLTKTSTVQITTPSNKAPVLTISNLDFSEDLPDLWQDETPQSPRLPAQRQGMVWNNPWATELETAFDWIETDARPAGYQYHFLELILAGLDRLVLWLEENLRRLIQWCRQTLWPNLKKLTH